MTLATKLMATDAPQNTDDLRGRLIEIASQLCLKGGLDQLSLREVARQAGVSHTAPYRHFKDKDDLLAAVAAEGLQQVALRIETGTQAIVAKSAADAGLQVKLLIAESIVALSVESPALFRLAFTERLGEAPELATAREQLFNRIVAVLYGVYRKHAFAIAEWLLPFSVGYALLCEVEVLPGQAVQSDRLLRDRLHLALKAVSAGLPVPVPPPSVARETSSTETPETEAEPDDPATES